MNLIVTWNANGFGWWICRFRSHLANGRNAPCSYRHCWILISSFVPLMPFAEDDHEEASLRALIRSSKVVCPFGHFGMVRPLRARTSELQT
jgi:hypothetical protein